MRFFLILMALAGFLPPGLLSAQAKAKGGPQPVSAPSMEILVFRAIEALNAKDTAALSRLTTGNADFLKVYPHFAPDTSSARRDFAADYFMSDNGKLMRRVIGQNGGQGLGLVRFTVMGPVEKYGESEMHRGLRIWVSHDSTEFELKFLKSIIRTGSSWKIWSFEDD